MMKRGGILSKRRSNKKNDNEYSNRKYYSNQKKIQPTTDTSDPNYFLNFTKSYLSQFNDPYVQNMMLKNINMNPRKIDRDKLLKLMEDPKRNETELREFSQYIENVVLQFKRLVMFFGSILVFDYYIEPTNADEEDMKTSSFIKSYKKASNWLERFNIKKQLPDIMRQILRQDAVFYYIRESKEHVFLQEMPSDYCKIINKTEFGYQYSFNMSYFFQNGANIDNYAPEFKKYFDGYKNNENQYNSKTPYWIDLDPIQAPCFKFDETIAGIVPPFMGLFPDVIDIGTYRELTKAKDELDVFTILLNKIPMHGGEGKVRKSGDFALSANDAGKFSKIMEDRAPNKKYFKIMTTPFESEIHGMQRSENGNSKIDKGNDLFFNSAAINQNILGGDSTTSSGITASLNNVKSFVIHMYPVFERFINTHLRLVTGRYRWRIHLEGTEHDRADRFERAYKAASSGFPKSWVVCAMGRTPDELVNMSNFENSMDYVDKLVPFISAHTQSNSGNGAPKKTNNNIGDDGEHTRDLELNE